MSGTGTKRIDNTGGVMNVFFNLKDITLSGPLYPKLSTCFEGARLTQLVQLVTASRLFPCHEGRVDP